MLSSQTARAWGRRAIAELGLETGSAMLEVALIMPALLLVLAGAVDYGRGYYASIEVSSAAEAGALYGAQNPTDTNGMQSASVLDANDIADMTANASYGCECSDGTQISSKCATTPSGCSGTVVNYVEVDTSANYVPYLNFPGIPSSFTLTGMSRIRAEN